MKPPVSILAEIKDVIIPIERPTREYINIFLTTTFSVTNLVIYYHKVPIYVVYQAGMRNLFCNIVTLFTIA